MEKSIAVIVPTYRGTPHLVNSIPTLLSQSYKNYQIIIVDNNSKSEEYLVELAEKHSNITVLRNAENRGFTGGVNTGIAYALAHSFEYIALFNDDAKAEKTWLASLAKTLDEKQDVAIVTSLILHADGKTIDSTGDWFSVWGLAFPRSRNRPTSEAPEAGYVFGASGGASMYRASLFRTIGLFDNYYFAYYEDVDVSFRTQLAGLSVFYNPKARAFHSQGETSKTMPGFTITQGFRNWPRLMFKNVPDGLLWRILPRFFLAYVLFLVNAVRRGNTRPALKGFFQSFRLSFQALFKERQIIQKHRKVSNRTLYKKFWPDLPPDQTGLRKFRDTVLFWRKPS